MPESYTEPKYANEQMIREMGYTGQFGAGGANRWLDETGKRAEYEAHRKQLGIDEGVQTVAEYAAMKAKAAEVKTTQSYDQSQGHHLHPASRRPSWMGAVAATAPGVAVFNAGFYIAKGRERLAERLISDSEFAEKFEKGQFCHFVDNPTITSTKSESIWEELKSGFRKGMNAKRPTSAQIEELEKAGIGRLKAVSNAGLTSHLSEGLGFAVVTTAVGSILYLYDKHKAHAMTSNAAADQSASR